MKRHNDFYEAADRTLGTLGFIFIIIPTAGILLSVIGWALLYAALAKG